MPSHPNYFCYLIAYIEDIASHNEGVSHVPTSSNGYKDAALEHMKTNSYGIKYPSPSRPIDLGRSNDV